MGLACAGLEGHCAFEEEGQVAKDAQAHYLERAPHSTMESSHLLVQKLKSEMVKVY